MWQNITSSASESDIDLTPTHESSDEDCQPDVTEGDYAIVKFAGNSRIRHYIGHVDVIDGDDMEGTFLRRVLG